MREYQHHGNTNGRMRRQRIKRNRRRLLLCVILLCLCVIGIHKIMTKNAEEKQTVVSPVYLSELHTEVPDTDMPTPHREDEEQNKETVTPLILDILKQEQVQATFFVLGQNIDKSETSKEILKRIVEEGHAIGNHTYSHSYARLYPNKKVDVSHFMSEIERTNESLKKVLGEGFTTRGIRFPGGHMTWKQSDPEGVALLDKKLIAEGYHQVDWNVLPKDAEGAPKKAQQLVTEFKNSVKGREKAVILMHDTYGKEETAKALPEIIAYLKEQGYTFKIMK